MLFDLGIYRLHLDKFLIGELGDFSDIFFATNSDFFQRPVPSSVIFFMGLYSQYKTKVSFLQVKQM